MLFSSIFGNEHLYLLEGFLDFFDFLVIGEAGTPGITRPGLDEIVYGGEGVLGGDLEVGEILVGGLGGLLEV